MAVYGFGGTAAPLASNVVLNSDGDAIAADFLGLQPDGTALNTGVGLTVKSASNTIGGSGAVTIGPAGASVTVANPGNLISGNAGDGILLTGAGATGNRVLGSTIGADVTGATAVPNGGSGVTIVSGASLNTIGGSKAGEGNLISGNAGSGVSITGTTATSNLLLGNFVGTTADGKSVLAGTSQPTGVFLDTTTGNTIGAGNVVSGGTSANVEINGGSKNVVSGSFVGTNASGSAALAGTSPTDGVYVNGSASNTITGNLISGNATGVVLSAAGATDNVVISNRIGTDAAGSAAVGNNVGVSVDTNASGNAIGQSGSGNLISGNSADGIQIINNGASANTIAGNTIGLDLSGSAKLANGGAGLNVGNSSLLLIGGSATGAGNVIAGNAHEGVILGSTSPALSNTIQGNAIGTDRAGTATTLGNGADGILIKNGSDSNLIGASQADAQAHAGAAFDLTPSPSGNTIAYNGGDGVHIVDATLPAPAAGGQSVSILSNAIFLNVGGGIVIGPLSNIDPGTGKTVQAPAIAVLTFSAPFTAHEDTYITATVTGGPNTTYTVQFFDNATNDDEGRTLLGTRTVTTDASGSATFTAQVSGFADLNGFYTATLTSPDGSTSEFSATTKATDALVVTNANATGPGSLNTAIANADFHAGVADIVHFNIPAAPTPYTIALNGTPLPAITDPISFDYTGQAGYDAKTCVPIIVLDGTNTPGDGLSLSGNAGGLDLRVRDRELRHGQRDQRQQRAERRDLLRLHRHRLHRQRQGEQRPGRHPDRRQLARDDDRRLVRPVSPDRRRQPSERHRDQNDRLRDDDPRHERRHRRRRQDGRGELSGRHPRQQRPGRDDRAEERDLGEPSERRGHRRRSRLENDRPS